MYTSHSLRKGQIQITDLRSGLSGELLGLINLIFLVQHRPDIGTECTALSFSRSRSR